MRRLGYDPRGFPLQVGIAGAATVAARFTDAALNIKSAHAEPFFGSRPGPPAVHLALSLAVLALVAYGATDRTLRATLPEVKADPGAAAEVATGSRPTSAPSALLDRDADGPASRGSAPPQ